MNRAEYFAGYLAGTGAVPVRVHYKNFEADYDRGLCAGIIAGFWGVDLSGGAL